MSKIEALSKRIQENNSSLQRCSNPDSFAACALKAINLYFEAKKVGNKEILKKAEKNLESYVTKD